MNGISGATLPASPLSVSPEPRPAASRPRLRVPFVQQLAADDCGAACMAMVLAAHGVSGVAAECRRLCDAGREGTRVRTLISVADRFGLVGRAVSIGSSDVRSLVLPAIAHWNGRHFVVVERCTARRVTIVDPARGRQTLSLAEFDGSFTGTALEFRATPALSPRTVSRVPLWVWYLVAMFRDHSAKLALAQVVAGSLLLQIAGLAMPVFTKLVVDDIAPRGAPELLDAVGLAMVMLVVGKTVTTLLRSAVMIRLQSRLDQQLTERFFDHLLRLPFRFFQGRSSGDLLMRLSSNTMIREILTTQLLSLLLDGPFTLIYLAILVVMSPSFALVVAGIAVAQVLIVAMSLRRIRELSQRSVATKSEEQSCLVELMKGIAYVKASGAETRAYERWVTLFRRQLTVFVERTEYSARLEAALGIVRSAAPLLLLWYGAVLVLEGELPLGTMLALTAVAAAFLTPVMSLVQNAQHLQMLDAHVERLADVVATEPEPVVLPGLVRSRRLSGHIEMRGVAYRYSSDSTLVVDDLSFVVEPGRTLGIVGPTGSGKSTVLMLLLGLYRPIAGEILFDGVPFGDLDLHAVRQNCGVVMQDNALFGGSLRSNITLNKPHATAEQLDAASRLTGLDADVAHLPLGFETRIAESGSNLSGGQRQRVAIARALVGTPSILLLDEASSHLDVASEARLNSNLAALDCTKIVIAHRLSAVRAADEILVMQAGRVVERGNHDTLMRARGVYATLALAQGPTRA